MMQPQMISAMSGVATEREAVIEDMAGTRRTWVETVYLHCGPSVPETHFGYASHHVA
jgi:hypothetical protein